MNDNEIKKKIADLHFERCQLGDRLLEARKTMRSYREYVEAYNSGAPANITEPLYQAYLDKEYFTDNWQRCTQVLNEIHRLIELQNEKGMEYGA